MSVYKTDKFSFSFTCVCSHFSNILEVIDEFSNPELDGYNLMKYLLDHVGEDINLPLICGPSLGTTMLQSAIKHKNKRMVELLMKYPALKIDDSSEKWIKESSISIPTKVYNFAGLEITYESLIAYYNVLIDPLFKEESHEPDGFKLFKSFISVMGDEINFPLRSGGTMLEYAVTSHCKKMVKILMKHPSIKIDDDSAKWIKENM